MDEKEKKEKKEKKEETQKNTENKKDIKKEEKNKKVDNKVKGKVTVEGKKSKKAPVITAIVIIILLILAIILYVFLANGPKSVVEGMFKALRDGDYEKVNEYVNYKEIISSSEVLDTDNLNEETMKLLFDKLSWKITDVTQEDSRATVTIEVTNKNFRTIIGNYMQNVLRVAFSGGEPTDAEMQNYLLEELRNEEVETTTTTQTINLTKQDGKWVVSTTDNDLVNILLPGLNEAVNSLS